ncbi:DUF6428 family protein [Maribacter cobaltidurans]|uniref:Uncharacterized protein n=1 Tax=Maribacter cobaltidurans TaxID=1178778 RepID=A0A223V383_9FLAO|nr:DUF6428 family protein [Maribacter cobaltidurans]ASV29782.1 hypothetical protein CJ263_05865 [Maribacter cobaltidurans]GGD92587.1 hypothetical protein GCM10011412_33190 [Maribacter cobaltidurans]
MKTKELLNILKENSTKNLLFEYTPGQFVGAHYHITEVKNVTIDSIDCGANPDFWKETVIQLWESPKEKGKRDYMSAYKALSILNKVDKIKPMEREVEVKFEYSNASFHTSQLYVNDYQVSGENLIFKLGVEQTDCKAKETCGIPETVAETVSECAPSSGCC